VWKMHAPPRNGNFVSMVHTMNEDDIVSGILVTRVRVRVASCVAYSECETKPA